MDDHLRQRRLDVLAQHFQSEVDHDWDTCIGTFNGHPRYEIMPTGQIFDGDDAVRNYHRRQREAFPDQRHEHARFHCADDDTVVAEFDLLGTNTGPLLGHAPTGRAFRVPAIAVFSFEGDRIVNERVYLDVASMFGQIGRLDLLTGGAASPADASGGVG